MPTKPKVSRISRSRTTRTKKTTICWAKSKTRKTMSRASSIPVSPRTKPRFYDFFKDRFARQGVRTVYQAGLDWYGAIAQLGERLHGMQEVSGSIPLGSTISRLSHRYEFCA